MDDLNFQIKNIEFHLRQTSIQYDKCVSKAIRKFMDSESDFSGLIKHCEPIKVNLNSLMKEYQVTNNTRLNS